MNQPKYIFVTGGVVSSLGKGIVAASLGRILKNRGLNVSVQKFDPYINIDPGTMSPYQHGETFVTDDGTETDLDLGHYERFMDIDVNQYSNVTTGKVYSEVLEKERNGDYNGSTVQVIPNITDAIKEKMQRVAETTDSEIIITEIGGTVGDIESLPFIEAIRQMKSDLGNDNVFYIHTSLVPKLSAAGELKTKPTQHSVRELRSYGIQPDMIVVRSEESLPESMKEKLSLFTDVPEKAIIESTDAEILYQVPLNLEKQHMDDVVLDKFKIDAPKADMSDWSAMIDNISSLNKEINITLVGKYTDLPDAYISINEALRSAGYSNDVKVNIKSINSETVNENNVESLLNGSDGLIVPGGYGARGTEGKISAIKYARENNLSFLGVCLGMQLAAIEFSRNVLGHKDANSMELNNETSSPVIALMDSQKKVTELGGTQRLGAYTAKIKPDTIASKAYNGDSEISERHRHRYEFNNNFKNEFENKGMVFSGTSKDGKLVDIIELSTNNFFVGVQYHPEFLSRPNRPEGIYKSFIAAAKRNKK